MLRSSSTTNNNVFIFGLRASKSAILSDPTHSLTNCRLVNLIDVTLACEDPNSKPVEVATVADDDLSGWIEFLGSLGGPVDPGDQGDPGGRGVYSSQKLSFL